MYAGGRESVGKRCDGTEFRGGRKNMTLLHAQLHLCNFRLHQKTHTVICLCMQQLIAYGNKTNPSIFIHYTNIYAYI